MDLHTSQYRKHFIPLESNPVLFTELIHRLGASEALQFHDVLSLDDTDLLDFIPRPALALILVFPTTPAYESKIAEQDRSKADYAKSGDDEDVVWYRQTINNACGFYGILHAVSNGDARDFIVPSSHLSSLLATCASLDPVQRASALEGDEKLESEYSTVALQGDTEPPENSEDEVDYHYVCFVKSHKNGHLYELDGDRKGPVDWGHFEGSDMLSEEGLSIIKKFIKPIASDVGFSLLALAPGD
ncbi:Ubiquitin carboxyl-terminal hydrolase [Pleurostoma richardsiae]|uniref:Ubiquitin carboxyl-terminal hydrolase n=1 Tax=Pleurostoma richardsiae TaxID=41990 RepID=A0AA38RE54_9PEZI|nr:Ubiquitin carboxyl-terminal hydrolase [Pleurostoma richardsiae]